MVAFRTREPEYTAVIDPDSPLVSIFHYAPFIDCRNNLTVILSAIYAVFLVTLGVVIGVADLIVPETNLGEVLFHCGLESFSSY